MPEADKPLAWLHGEVKTPPFSKEARIEVGGFLRRLQRGEALKLPHSRPMPSVGARCHELRIPDGNVTWRLVYRVDSDAVIIAEIFSKKTQTTPDSVIATCRQRRKRYDEAAKGDHEKEQTRTLGSRWLASEFGG